MKRIFTVLILAFIFHAPPIKAQHNPYLDKKAKNKPSAIMARKDRKHTARQKKLWKKNNRRAKRHAARKSH